jgi:hypothetical protein
MKKYPDVRHVPVSMHTIPLWEEAGFENEEDYVDWLDEMDFNLGQLPDDYHNNPKGK